MRTQQFVWAVRVTVALLAGVLVAPAVAGTLGVTVTLGPSQQVAPGAVLDLYMQVTRAGDGFNGFDAVIGYDPAALTLVPLEPLWLQEGTYLTAAACGGTFHRFSQGVSTDSITDVILCSGVSLPGPGQVYHLRFRAATTPQVTSVQFLSGTEFFNAGLYVTPLYTTNAVIGIGMAPPVDVGPDGPLQGLSLKAAPNPSSGGMAFTIQCDRAGPETLTVFDVQGRVVRRFAQDREAPGVHTVIWDGRNDAQARLSPGAYLVRLEVAGRAAWSRVTLLH